MSATGRRSDDRSYVVLLRGVNVGGKHSLPMKAFAQLLVDLGASDVRTYIQSGNAVVRAPAKVAKTLARDLAAAIEARFGFPVPVVIRDGDELRAVIAGLPFEGEPSAVHVGFLAGAPTSARLASLDPQRSPGDEFVVRGSEVYLRCPNGLGRSKLTTAYFDAKLATTITLRNWRTVQALAAMLEAPSG